MELIFSASNIITSSCYCSIVANLLLIRPKTRTNSCCITELQQNLSGKLVKWVVLIDKQCINWGLLGKLLSNINVEQNKTPTGKYLKILGPIKYLEFGRQTSNSTWNSSLFISSTSAAECLVMQLQQQILQQILWFK